MVKKVLVVLIVFIAFTEISLAQDISAEASADSTAYQIGDYIHYTIRIAADKNLSVAGPAVSDTLAGMELISQLPPQKEQKDNKQLITYSYTFSKYDSSDVTVPPVTVYYKSADDTVLQAVNTNAVFFTVRPLKVNAKGDIKDVKEPLKIPLDWWWVALWVLTGLIIIVTAYYFYKRYQKRKAEIVPEKIVIKIPAHVTALKSLRGLREKQLWQKGMIKEYHSEITEIIRRYFEERFNLPALEMTSGEALDELRKRRGTEIIIDDTYNFLSNADLVKFAKYEPLASVNEEMMKQALDIVQKTKADEKETADKVTEDVQ
jgi:hypothetical protein